MIQRIVRAHDVARSLIGKRVVAEMFKHDHDDRGVLDGACEVEVTRVYLVECSYPWLDIEMDGRSPQGPGWFRALSVDLESGELARNYEVKT